MTTAVKPVFRILVARNIIEQVNLAANQGILVDVRNYSPELTAIC